MFPYIKFTVYTFIYLDCCPYLLYYAAQILLFTETLAYSPIINTAHTAAFLSCMNAISSCSTQGYRWNYNNVEYVSRKKCFEGKHVLWSSYL